MLLFDTTKSYLCMYKVREISIFILLCAVSDFDHELYKRLFGNTTKYIKMQEIRRRVKGTALEKHAIRVKNKINARLQKLARQSSKDQDNDA